MNDDFEKMMKHVLRIAEREGVRPPVIALLKHDSMHASSIVKKMTGHSINYYVGIVASAARRPRTCWRGVTPSTIGC